MKRIAAAASLVLALVLLSSASEALANEPFDLDAFTAANLLYEDGSYQEAAMSYEHLVGLGYDDPSLYYNLANSYYRTGDFGRAVINYLRAERLAPFDADIRANLDLAWSQREDKGYSSEPIPALAQIAELVPWVSTNQAVMASLALWLALGAIIYAYFRVRHGKWGVWLARAGVIAAIGLLTSVTLAAGGYAQRSHWERVAVVTAESTDVRAGPGLQYPGQFSIGAGNETNLIDTRGGWHKIGIPRTSIEGWIPASEAEIVWPRGD